jgi:hypothetical protein
VAHEIGTAVAIAVSSELAQRVRNRELSSALQDRQRAAKLGHQIGASIARCQVLSVDHAFLRRQQVGGTTTTATALGSRAPLSRAAHIAPDLRMETPDGAPVGRLSRERVPRLADRCGDRSGGQRTDRAARRIAVRARNDVASSAQ